jgi:protein-S-isoprenylcysteine O-methyltransferase Ste14
MPQLHDRPDVMVFPPLIPLATLAIACGLQWWMPLAVIDGVGRGWRIGAGAIAIVAGAIITISGRIALVRLGTNVNPSQPTTALATRGIFALTRNPLYVGILPVMCGIALVFALDWLVLLVVPSYFVLHFCVIRREEQYLERKFGEDYRRYKARVPRYTWPFLGRSSSPTRSNSRQEI